MEEYVLATTNPPSLFQFYPTEAAAHADAARAVSTARIFGAGEYTPMTYTAYKAAERHFYLDKPITEITVEKFDEMLCELPPLHFRQQGGFTSFLMSDFWSGPYTEQYAAFEGRHFVKMVDATNQATWMTPAMLRAEYQGSK